MKIAARKQKLEEPPATVHHLLFCEHPHVYTLGKSGNHENLLLNREGLEARGISFFPINRGGDITYHGPGQVTGYTIFDLEKFRTDLSWFLRSIEEVMILLLSDYGLKGGRIQGATGVWLDIESPFPRKICALGLRFSRWISMHGFALNVNTDLSFFDHIVPCGISDKGVTSLEKELGKTVDMKEIRENLCEKFEKVFDVEILNQAGQPVG